MIDLGKWLDEEYRVKGGPADVQSDVWSGSDAPSNEGKVIPFPEKKES
jgi:hypothetical protein